MDNFIVSARKYRPLSFDTVVGQTSITNTLKNAIKSKHLAHAYLFCGPRGIGKTTCARIFAKTINCANLTENTEACGKCESCVSFSESRSYNIHELDAASNNSVDDIRNLTDQVRIPPQIGKYSVYIIDEVHMLSQQAFNAFLKTLEEPPGHAVFILATTEKHKIIPTILSRCQIYDFSRMGVENMVSHLENIANKEDIKYESEAFNIIAQKADGAMRDALSIFDQIVSFTGKEITYQKVIENLNILDYEYYFRLTDAFLEEDIPSSLLIFNEILDKGFDPHNFINGLSKHFRDLLVIKDEATIKLIEVGDSIREKYRIQSAKCTPDFLFTALEITNEYDINYRIGKDKRLHVELCLIKLGNILSVQKKKEHSEPIGNGENNVVKIDDVKEKGDEKKNRSSINENIDVANGPVNNVKTVKRSTPSIKEALKTFENKKNVIESEVVKEKEEHGAIDLKFEEPFSREDVIEKWNEYAMGLKKDNMRLHITMKNREPDVSEDFVVKVLMDNRTQLDDFEKEVKIGLASFLRKELKNDKIDVITYLGNTENEPRRAYTDADKFDHMSRKNPSLKKLKNDLNLDFE